MRRIIAFVVLMLAVASAQVAMAQCGQNTHNAQCGGGWTAGVVVAPADTACYLKVAFSVSAIPQGVAKRMIGKSFPTEGALISIDELRYVPMLHVRADGTILTGEMVVNRAIANDIAAIFKELFRQRYPIERIELIDEYNAEDEQSMRANNSSSFCYRTVAGSKKLSKHAMGMAVDINPLYNPYFKIVRNAAGDSIGYRSLQPATATDYVSRQADYPYKIVENDLAVQLFLKYGFEWGGDWPNTKDYQHFER